MGNLDQSIELERMDDMNRIMVPDGRSQNNTDRAVMIYGGSRKLAWIKACQKSFHTY